MERKINVRHVLLTLAAVALIGIFIFILFYDNQLQNLQILNFNNTQTEKRQEQTEYEQLVIQNTERVQTTIDKELTGIVLYGDNYLGGGRLALHLQNTFETELFQKINGVIKQYPSILGHELKIPVANFEVVNENLDTIMTRIGAEPLLVAKRFVIPADTTPVEISLKTVNGTEVDFLSQSSVSMGTATINDIEGNIQIAYNDDKKIYTFTRNIAGDETTIVSGTKVYTELQEKYREYIPVIFFGNNDYTILKNYLNRYKEIVQHQTTHQDKYIIICCAPANSTLDTAMTETFGYNYIRTDKEIDYTDLAEKVYFRMKTLKYLNILNSSIEKAERKILPEE